ncbi:MAG: hypothetical protein QHJ73_11220 [Armatimonadota bacterium]|nr:hypothetical protein [Armatimonadota bacterium]
MWHPSTTKLIALAGFASSLFCETAWTAPRTLRVYHIGNSLTRGITPDRLHQLMEAAEIDYQFGAQLSGGATLARHWSYAEHGLRLNLWETNRRQGNRWEPGPVDANREGKRFGPYDQALAQFQWDALVLQPYGSHLCDDLPAAARFLRFALEKKAGERFFVYATWPRRPERRDAQGNVAGFEQIDYAALWERPYPYTEKDPPPPSDAYRSRAYFAALVEGLNREFPQLPTPVRMIPVGEVFFQLDQRLKAGQIPGVDDLYRRNPALLPGYQPATGTRAGANILYADGIHTNPVPHLEGTVGGYLAALTHFALLTGQTPLGLPGKPYGLDDRADAALIGALQQTVWDVVRHHPHAGLTQASGRQMLPVQVSASVHETRASGGAGDFPPEKKLDGDLTPASG